MYQVKCHSDPFYTGSRQMSQPDETQLQDKVNTLLSSGEETRKVGSPFPPIKSF